MPELFSFGPRTCRKLKISHTNPSYCLKRNINKILTCKVEVLKRLVSCRKGTFIRKGDLTLTIEEEAWDFVPLTTRRNGRISSASGKCGQRVQRRTQALGRRRKWLKYGQRTARQPSCIEDCCTLH